MPASISSKRALPASPASLSSAGPVTAKRARKNVANTSATTADGATVVEEEMKIHVSADAPTESEPVGKKSKAGSSKKRSSKKKKKDVVADEETLRKRAEYRERLKQEQTEQYKIFNCSLSKFVKWVKKEKSQDLGELLQEFRKKQDHDLEQLGFKKQMTFGKHRGTSYIDLWKDPERRQYLEWICKQEWCYEDVKKTVASLKRFHAVPNSMAPKP